MHEHEIVAALIDRVVAGAHIPSRVEREDLRRELWTHFEEAGMSPEAVHAALHRFGAESLVIESLRRVYRWDYVFLYLAKIAVSIMASIGAALLIQVLVNLRVDARPDVWRLAPGFWHGTVLSIAVVFALAAAREAARQPFNRSRAMAAIGAYAAVSALVQLVFANTAGTFVTAMVLVVLGALCSRIKARSAKLLLTYACFASAVAGTHFMRSITLGPARTLVASAVLVAVWASTADRKSVV